MESIVSRLVILASPFVKIGVSFRCVSHGSEVWYTQMPGRHTLGNFCDFKLRERTADSSTLGPISDGTYLH